MIATYCAFSQDKGKNNTQTLAIVIKITMVAKMPLAQPSVCMHKAAAARKRILPNVLLNRTRCNCSNMAGLSGHTKRLDVLIQTTNPVKKSKQLVVIIFSKMYIRQLSEILLAAMLSIHSENNPMHQERIQYNYNDPIRC